MSTHPNAMIQLVLHLKPEEHEDFKKNFCVDKYEEEDYTVTIDGKEYHAVFFTDGYEEWDESHQVSGEEGDIILYDLITYGYGESISFTDVQEKNMQLLNWAQKNCRNFHYEVRISANYW